MKKDIPWYQDFEKKIKRAIEVRNNLDKDMRANKGDVIANEIRSFCELQLMRSIYESNLIEGAGLKSAGETKRLIDENFPEMIDSFPFYNDCINKGKNNLFDIIQYEKISKTYDDIMERGLPIVPSAKFGTRTKQIYEVTKHYVAFKTMENHVFKWNMKRILGTCGPGDSTVIPPAVIEKLRGYIGEYNEHLCSEKVIKAIHIELMDGLLPKSAGTPAGEYRNHDVTVDYDVVFPSHRNVAVCMKEWEIKSNAMMVAVDEGKVDPITAAAMISYDFVLIHPFPDGNGRLSRLIMNMILTAKTLPFYVDIRGGKKHKHRYMTALKHANKGNVMSLACLIAIRISEIITEIYGNVSLASGKQ